uniref:Alpha-N-acetylgalactosamine-specific lectin-like n=1 Tax=Ciona intestinalis TaxID=7719 RepID=F6SYC7_CIOIN|nr:alpha-N-acetylgalactosamine-specific lectin-like [Ciona intestinalis]|eukprot:XP_002125316.1 alpha-N-acetylgalactosamine-specific lectin-like [Ciona intestinalis]
MYSFKICVVLLIMLHPVVQARYAWYGPGNGYAYFVIDINLSYGDAKLQCGYYGATLAVHAPKDRRIMKILEEHLTVLTEQDYWIGLNDIQREGRFVWEDGTLLTKSQENWYPTEPNNYGRGEDCVGGNHAGSLKWNDYRCSYGKLYALCERAL